MNVSFHVIAPYFTKALSFFNPVQQDKKAGLFKGARFLAPPMQLSKR